MSLSWGRGVLGALCAVLAMQVGAEPAMDREAAVARIKEFLQRGRTALLAPGPGQMDVLTQSIHQPKSIRSPAPISKPLDLEVPATLILRMQDPKFAALANANQPLPADTLSELEQWGGESLTVVRALSGGAHLLRIGRPLSRGEFDALLARLQTFPGVDYVEGNERAHVQALVPNDAYFPLQWHLWTPPSEDATQTLYGVNAVRAWDGTTGASSITIAVVDTGVRPHPEYAARLLPGYDFVSSTLRSNDGDGRDADAFDPGDYADAGECGSSKPAQPSSWHGTHVTGIAAATGNNGTGVAGLDWRARIVPVRVLGKCGGDLADIADGIAWAAGIAVPGAPNNANAARVINLSVRGPGACTRHYQEVINSATARGALVVVAAGNEHSNVDESMPANCDGVLRVAATGPLGELASYSNYGDRISIAAPGGDMNRYRELGGIYSTVNSGTREPTTSSYGYKQGTSMAAPVVSGVASLMLSANPALSPQELAFWMRAMAGPFNPQDAMCAAGQCGVGIVDAYWAVGAAAVLKDYVVVTEFYNVDIRHYFRTASMEEAAEVLAGYAGPGWYDTLDYFLAFNKAINGAKAVCRFYGTPGIGPNSHFYTVDQAECNYVKANDPGWQYEGIAFYAIPASGGVCPANTKPVYRLYNGRWRENDSNHRYTTSQSIYQQMTAAGWEPEGIAFCGT